MDDLELLREFARQRSESAFSTLVGRYVNLVHSAACRQVRDAQLAEEVTQAVFLILARKAGVIGPGVVLSGWLIRTTHFTAANALRREERRQQLEREAMMAMSDGSEHDDAWVRVAPLLDEALAGLRDKERDAVVLRFMERRSFREVGEALGLSEDTAQKRVSRALEKLRSFLGRRGGMIPSAALTGVLLTRSVEAAPVGLVNVVTGAVPAKGGAAIAAASLCETTLQILTWTRRKMMALRSAALLVAAVTVWFVVQHQIPDSLSAPVQVRSARAEQPGFGQSALPASFPAATAPQPPGQRFVFRVVNATNDAPVSDAKLTLMQTTEFPNRSTNEFFTDRNGFGMLPLPTGGASNWSYRIEVFRDGYVPRYVSWGASQGDLFGDFPTAHTTRLDPGVLIGGVVRNESGEPIEGVRVVFSVSGPAPGSTRERERPTMMGDYHAEVTDAEGRWSCSHVPEHFGMISWRLSHPEHQDTTYYSESPEASQYVGVTRLPREDFLARRALMPMKRGMIVTGVVTDEAGRPIPAAKVTKDRNFRKPESSLVTDAKGRFRFQNARERKLILTVEAEGFAPTDAVVEVRPGLEEQRLVLKEGQFLRGRVQDESGTPITNASVTVAPDPNNRQVFEWRVKTDQAGRFEWRNAPVPTRPFYVSADGFESQHNLMLNADGTEQPVTLKRSTSRRRLRVMAQVDDADSGRPVEAFKVLVSEIRTDSLGTATSGAEPAGTGSGGRITFAVSSYASGFIAEFQAEGYTPTRSTNVNSGQGELELNIALKKGAMVRGVVQAPDGRPLAGATVVLCAGTDGAEMRSAGQIQRGSSKTATQVETDEHGRFSFSPRLEMSGVIIAHKLGYAEATVEQLATSEAVTVVPWGRIEGVFKIGAEPVANEAMALQSQFWNPSAWPALQIRLTTKTDSLGRFAFESVPIGELRVQHEPAFRGGKVGEVPVSHSTPVIVKPGETTQVLIGGSGRRIVGRIDTNAVAGPIDWLRDVHKLKLKVATPPEIEPPKREDCSSEAGFREAATKHVERARHFWASEAGKAIIRQRRQYVLIFEPDGSFQVNDVPPGTYELSVTPMEPPTGPIRTPGGGTAFPAFGTKPIGSVKMEIVVPEAGDGDNGSAIDLGILPLKPAMPE